MKLIKTGCEKLDYYCEGVKTGKIEVCRWVQLAVDRHYNDLSLQHKKDFPYYFDPGTCESYVSFFSEYLKHYEGAVVGEPLIFEPWQWFSFGSVFGWLKKKQFRNIPIRRFRKAHIIIPKKNGKTIISGGTGLYMMDFDEWAGAQCYILATSQKHAAELGYNSAVSMLEKSEFLSNRYKVNRSAGFMGIYYKENNSCYKPTSSRAESEDGKNVHFFGPDETKDWRSKDIYNTMVQGTVNAPNSLILTTTTAGTYMDSIGYENQKYLEKVLTGDIKDETCFGVIYTIDDEDRKDEDGNEIEDWWLQERIWAKANPNYEVSVYRDSLIELSIPAKQNPVDRMSFQTKHLNVWHSVSSSFIERYKWDRCNFEKIPAPMKNFKDVLAKFSHRKAYAGLDIGHTDDFTSFVVVFEPEEGRAYWDIVPFFWIPELSLPNRKNKHLIYPWVEAGYIQTTSGEVMDEEYTEQHILEIIDHINLIELPFDQRNAFAITQELMKHGVPLVNHRQTYQDMNIAVANFEILVRRNQVNHGGNPVLSWMLENVMIMGDRKDNRSFDKKNSQDKIDGIVALAMALARGNINQQTGNVHSGELFAI